LADAIRHCSNAAGMQERRRGVAQR